MRTLSGGVFSDPATRASASGPCSTPAPCQPARRAGAQTRRGGVGSDGRFGTLAEGGTNVLSASAPRVDAGSLQGWCARCCNRKQAPSRQSEPCLPVPGQASVPSGDQALPAGLKCAGEHGPAPQGVKACGDGAADASGRAASGFARSRNLAASDRARRRSCEPSLVHSCLWEFTG